MFFRILKRQFLVLAAAFGVLLAAGAANAQTVKKVEVTANAQTPIKADALPKGKSYVFTLESFQITDTRSRHNDTDHVTFAVKVGDKVYPAKVKNMGDLNNGTYKVNLSFGPIEVPTPETKVNLTYLIMNSGHDQDKVSDWLKKAAEGLLTKGAAAAGGPWGIAIGVVGDLGLGIAFANCDGWVAGDHIALTGKTLAGYTKPHRETRNYKGIDSPRGCGGNSHYYVTWSITQK
jgi:hypothetical protein